MKDQPQYVIIYKDHATARNRYYGPFVSDSLAEDFMSDLPEPLPGGLKVYKLVSPFTFDEARLASMEIMQSRNAPHHVAA